ncbi:MAG TPA: D-2-hydroxyacid dehydrogenase [Acidimicrobiales bacterium]|nr:D-2-hydroxyacid dehydrogenase [Acidimicrobiales bacterium]
MLVLLTDVAHDRFWPLVARPGVEPLIMDRGAQLVLADGSRVERERADAEVAWGTSDLFGDGAPLRPFLGMVRRAPSLRWFQSPAAGFDEPFFADLVRRGVLVTNAHVNGIPIAEFVLRAVLDHFQAAHLWRAAESGHQWKLHDYREVAGTTWLVIGLGSIGGGVARRAAAFGARVIGCRRHPRPDDPTDRTVTLDELPEVIGEADVVILCAPATSETRGIVGEEFLRHMKPASLIVNVARGSLVDEDALLRALDRGRPAHAILDVFASEPLPADHPFWDHPAVTVTPHNAAGGTGRYRRQAELFAANLDRYLGGQDLLNDVSQVIRDVAGP